MMMCRSRMEIILKTMLHVSRENVKYVHTSAGTDISSVVTNICFAVARNKLHFVSVEQELNGV